MSTILSSAPFRFAPVDRMRDRVQIDREDSDVAAFFSLLYYGELVVKLLVLGLVSALPDDRDRTRYGRLHKLVRADSIGEWVAVADDVLVGRAAVLLGSESSETQRDLTQRFSAGAWQYDCVEHLRACLNSMDIPCPSSSGKLPARYWFSDFALLRNKTRGHAAPRGHQCARGWSDLYQSIELLATNASLLRRSWAHLHQNLSGKYRVSALGPDSEPFNHLKGATNERYRDGIYIAFGDVIKPVDLILSDVDLSDFLIANGGFNKNTYELLSYITNSRTRADATSYSTPVTPLPPSHTQGTPTLDAINGCWTNLPPQVRGYIERKQLEEKLIEQLYLDRHPIITLTGPGGIGKTSLTLSVLHRLIRMSKQPFSTVLWLSARDIDLLPEGPKPVAAHGLALHDFGRELIRLLESADEPERDTEPDTYMAEVLGKGPVGPTLFVFDNFETVVTPPELFSWLDTYIRLPNKMLITTRMREFAGDYPIEVGGMTDDEANQLIDLVSRGLRIRDLISPQYAAELRQESDGHPYVLKILLGEIAKTGRASKPRRIVAAQDQILGALFERSYASLSASAQRVFLLLCSWRSVVPRVAVEGILLRPENERLDVSGAFDELVRVSLVEELVSARDDQVFISVPLAATTFGQRKLMASPLKATVEADSKLLQVLGASRKEDVRHGLMPRLERLLTTVARKGGDPLTNLEPFQPLIELICSRVPRARLAVAKFHRELGSREGLEIAKDNYRRFLEGSSGRDIAAVWRQLAEACKALGDSDGEIHSLVECAQAPEISTDALSSIANRINNLYRELRDLEPNRMVDSDAKVIAIQKVASAMSTRSTELDATDCSRLAWLYLNARNEAKAHELANLGHRKDPNNEYCLRLLERLG